LFISKERNCKVYFDDIIESSKSNTIEEKKAGILKIN